MEGVKGALGSALEFVRRLWFVPAGLIVIAVIATAVAVVWWQFTGWTWLDIVVAVLGLWVLVAAIRMGVDAKKDTELPWNVVATTYAALIAASYIAVRLETVTKLDVVLKADFQWFALLFILALAIERALEPLMQTEATGETDTSGTTQAKKKEAANIKKSRAVIGFMLGSIAGLVLAGILNLGLIDAVANVNVENDKTDGSWLRVFAGIDVIVTGLAIGAGTKPLHDLVTAIQKKAQASGG